MTWYRGDNIEWDVNYLWPFNQKGSNKGYVEIRSSSKPLYIKFTPANAVNLKGVILAVHAGSSSRDYNDDIVIELQESTDGGSTWNTVRSKTINFPNDVNAGAVKQYGKYIIDVRFDTSYPLNTSYQYRFKIYRLNGSSLYLLLSKNTSWSSWQSDVSNYAFRIIYSDTTGTPTSSDIFVITDELVIDQDWTVGYVTIPTSPSKDRLDSYNNKGSLWITSIGRLYVPSSITSDITVEIKGRMYVSGGDRVAWQIGDSEENPIPADKTVNWFFNCEGTSRRAGIYAYRSSWMKIEHYGSPIEKWYAVLKYDASAGSNQIVVEGDVTAEWKVGDRIRIGGAKYSATRHYNDYSRDHKYYEISALSYDAGNDETTITLTSNLSYPRDAGGRVLLVRRNVLIHGDEISSTDSRADTYIYYMRWWRAYWVRYSYMRYPAYFEGFNPKIPISEYPHTDILKGVLVDNCKYFYIRSRRNGHLEKVAICDSKTSSWSWGEGSYILYKSKGFTITEVVGIVEYYTVQFSQSNENTLSDFWIQGQFGLYFYLSSKNIAYNGTIFNTRYGIFLSGSSDNEIYNVEMKNIYYDSNSSATTQTLQGCFYYAGDIISQNNYIHDITIENAFTLFQIDIDDGCTDWYHNIVYTNITTEVYTVYREDWLDATRIRFTKRNGIENNDWIIYKYGAVHRTGNYTGADDATYRSAGGYNYALRLEPQVSGEDFDSYTITLTGCKTNKPVYYLGYIYVSSNYFAGTDVSAPEIYLSGLGIDYTSEPTAKWTHPGSSYADQWIPFIVVGTPTSDGNATIHIKVKSDGTNPYVYIDDDSYSWPESVDYRSHEVWINGQPANPPAVFPVITSLEIWSQAITALSETSTIGRLLTEHTGIVTPRYKHIKVNATERIIYSMEAENPHTVRINIYKQDGTSVVTGADMTKIGSTRYYYYDWTPTESGLYIIECYVENYVTKDSVIVNVLNEDDWYSTHSEVANIPSQVDTQLSGTHGNGGWEGTSPADVWSYATRTLTSLSGQPAQDIDDKLSSTHGSGSWEGTSPADVWSYSNRTLTSLAGQPAQDIDDKLSLSHGSGAWTGSTPSDIWNYSSRTLTSLSGQPAQDIDAQLSSTHGSGSWSGTTPEEIDNYLTTKHGSGSWQTGGGGGVGTSTFLQWIKKLQKQMSELDEKLSSLIEESTFERKKHINSEVNNLKEMIRLAVTDLKNSINENNIHDDIKHIERSLSAIITDLERIKLASNDSTINDKLDDVIKLCVKMLPDEKLEELTNGFKD